MLRSLRVSGREPGVPVFCTFVTVFTWGWRRQFVEHYEEVRTTFPTTLKDGDDGGNLVDGRLLYR